MNRRMITAGMGLGTLILVALAFTTYRAVAARLAPPQNPPAAPAAQWNLPGEGWSVCRIGGEEPIEGVGDRQVFDLCHAQGWTLKTYCLDPGMPVPQLGDLCSQLVGGTYWCGDGVQELGFVDVLQAPETATVPSATPESTATVTVTTAPSATVTETSPAIPQQQQTGYPPPEETAYPAPDTATVPAATAIVATVTTAPSATLVVFTPTVRSTPYQRPPAGGPGNLNAILPGLGGLGALGLGLAGLRRGWLRRAWRWYIAPLKRPRK